MKKVAIEFKNVTKRYRLFSGEGKKIRFLFNSKIKCKEKIAVDGVSFQIRKGERVAIVGRNGAGKTTILKMINGVSFPTEGEIKVRGKVRAIQELQAGFDREFTGRDNIRFRCRLYGMKEKEIDEVEQTIIDFAELGYYIDQPMRTYSNGMRLKLGFSINMNLKPDIIIADEVLSVGDAQFKKKCLKRIKQIASKDGVTFLFVTHSGNVAKKFCDRGIFLENGKIIFDGPIEKVVELYKESLKANPEKALESALADEYMEEQGQTNEEDKYEGIF